MARHRLCRYRKKAGCVGIRFMMNTLPHDWLLVNHLKFNKALLFCVMDLTEQIGMGVAAEAHKLIFDLQRKCFGDGLDSEILKEHIVQEGSKGASARSGSRSKSTASAKDEVSTPTPMETDGEPTTPAPEGGSGPTASTDDGPGGASSRASARVPEAEFLKLVKVLAAELLSPDDNIRELVKLCLAQLAKFSTIPLTQLLKGTSMKHVALPKSTRNSPINVQIGRMDAMVFCLTLDPPLTTLQNSPPDEDGVAAGGARGDARGTNNRNYIKEVLEICKLTDVQARAAGSRPGVPVNPRGLILLRRKAIELIAAIIVDENWAEFRKLALEYFVRALLSSADEIVGAAGTALSTLQRDIKLPKEDMQTAIRPLLSELSDAERLTIPMLKAISNLLELLPRSAFNQKFVDKMYEYWGAWLAKAQREVVEQAEG